MPRRGCAAPRQLRRHPSVGGRLPAGRGVLIGGFQQGDVGVPPVSLAVLLEQPGRDEARRVGAARTVGGAQ
ncbi:hypothetical protein [Actinomadura harenae]|uniref:hypothetical protein n=1 Tax=Actinomadura harenae TaxID=2483351 RepID=UPI0011C3497D|nr:hypothetical protein [Actinomadura harenae]